MTLLKIKLGPHGDKNKKKKLQHSYKEKNYTFLI